MILSDVILRDTNANRPAANTVPAGTLYHETDTTLTYRSDGSSWQSFSGGDIDSLLDGLGTEAQGDVIYRDGSQWTLLHAGTSGHFLKTLGAGANPAWAAIPGLTASNVDVTLRPSQNEPPASNPATFDVRNGHPVLDFDGSTDEEAVWTVLMPVGYAGGGLTLELFVAFTSATSGSVRFQAGIERIDVSSLDIDSDSFAAFQSAGGSAPGTSGQVIKITITFTDGAQMDSAQDGELIRVKVRRDADGTSGTDDITTDCELLYGVIKET